MAARFEVNVTIKSARDLKNVNWRYGDLRPYAVVWIDPAAKCSTKVDSDGNVNPDWDEKLKIPAHIIDDSTLHIDIVHAKSEGEDDTKVLVASAHLPLLDIVNEAGMGGSITRTFNLRRPSGRPQGKLDVKVSVKEHEPVRSYDPYAPLYSAPPPPYGQPPAPYYASPAPYGQAPPYGYSQPPYGAEAPEGYPYGAPPVYGGQQTAPAAEKNKSKFGMGLAVGAAAGILGGLALAEGIEHMEEKIEERVVENDLAYDEGCCYDEY